MVRQANPSLQMVRDDTIDALAISGDVGRALLLGKSRGGVTAADILEAVDRPELVGPAAVALSNTHGAPGELSRSLFETIVLGQMGPSERTQAALIAVRRHPELLSSEHAQAISKRLLTSLVSRSILTTPIRSGRVLLLLPRRLSQRVTNSTQP
jgi:hypothetical protein